MQEVQVLTARSEDFEQIFSLLPQLWPDTELNREKILQVYKQALESMQQEYIVAKVGERVVGFISMRIVTTLWAQGKLLHIEELVVDEAFRGRQIGTRLVQRVIAIAQQKSCKTVEVVSHASRTRAHNFYEINGFKKAAVFFIKEIAQTYEN